MAFDFEQLKQTIVSAGKEVGDKAKEVSSAAKIKLDIRTKEDFLTKQYTELGKAYYQAHKNEDVPEKSYFSSIEEAQKEIEKLQDELMDLQGAVLCPKCGCKQLESSEFCSKCGTNLSWVNPEKGNSDETLRGEVVSKQK